LSDLAQWIDAHAARAPQRAALICGEQVWSYAALAARIAGLAAWLEHDSGLAPGARLAWLGHNDPELLALLFACARTGRVFLPLNWRLGQSEIEAVLDDAGCATVVVDRSCHERIEALAGRTLWTAGGGWPARPALPDAVGTSRVVNGRGRADAPLLLVYTSGTTGTPKGAVLTQEALLYNALNSLDMHDVNARDVVLTVLPMFHVGGLNIQTLPALYRGATVVLVPRFEPAQTLELIARRRPSLTVQVPATLQALLAAPGWATTDLSSLRAITTGSTDVPVCLIEAVHARGVPVIQVYGATETGPLAIYQTIPEARCSVGSIGRAGLHTEISLRDQNGQACGPDAAGEIWVRGPHVASGYWDRARGAAVPFAGGWFKSGDVAVRDAAGLYWFKDRIKHVIISGGENVYPAELERVLAGHRLLKEAAVAGRPDARWGEVPVVVAVRGDGAVERADVLALFEGRLARYKHPRDVVFVDALPRTALGKVEVRKLRELARGG